MLMLRYETIGQLEYPAVFFLHGFMGDHCEWEPVAKQLSDHLYCVLLDLPGHNLSPPFPESEAEPFRRFSFELLELSARLGKRQFGLIGYSMGGRLAFYTAVTHPQNVTFLVVEGAHPGLSTSEKRRKRVEWEDSVVANISNLPFDQFLQWWYRMPIFESLRLRPDLLSKVLAERLVHKPSELAAAFRAFSLSRQPFLEPELKNLAFPIFLVAGEKDKKYRDIYERLAKNMNNSWLSIIPGAGHNAHRENPQGFLQALHRFLEVRVQKH